MRAVVLLLWCWVSLATAQTAPPVVVLVQNGAIGPASAEYLHRGLEKAAELKAQLVVVRMDTPGGLDTSMRAIIKDILASPVPVAVFVAPNGARAASAGTYILYASHVAAMAPATNLGAATPIAIGDTGETDESRRKPAKGKDKDKDAGSDSGVRSTRETMTRKVTNDAAAFIRGLAQLRGRNAEWADKAVREAVSLSADEALKLKVIDLVAEDVPQLLARLDGRKIAVPGGEKRLATAGANVVEYQPDWRIRLLSAITDPGVAYILMLIGIYGLLLEFYMPGAVAPGVIGGICLLVAMFAFHLLPVSYTGFALIVLGIGLLVAEYFVAGFGILGFGGVVAFAIGSVMLIDTDAPGFAIPLGLIGGATAVSALFLLAVLYLALRARKRPVVSGRERIVGATGEIVEDTGRETYARIQGEVWEVRSPGALNRGEIVRVTGIDGLVLVVEPERKGEGS
ncbi:MAG: serine protease [Betaproteobacteria bacterium RIFCSPLOWO2_02_FULL_67_26]|nr:MAG: serine protease [Betaproteobacteria bacterium RIFCSPLOWO2_02_FULL_67_26]